MSAISLSNETPNIMTSDIPQKVGLYEQIASTGPGLVAIVRPRDMNVIFANDAFGHYFGYTKEDVAQGIVFLNELLDSYQQTRFEYQVKGVLQDYENSSHYVIYQLKNKAGRISPFYVYLSVMNEGAEAAAEKLYYLLMHPDLSKFGMPFSTFDTKELFLEQFESEDFGTFEWILDVDKVYWSQGIYTIYEVEQAQETISSDFARSFVHPEDKELVSAENIGAIPGAEKDVDMEFRIVTAKGNTKTIHSLGRFIRDNKGKAVKFVGSIRDISRQRGIEDDLKSKVEELNYSNKELEEFAYVASHDMQEPLRKITTFGSRLMEKYQGVLTGEGSMYLSRMTNAAENMRRLITDLLDFSRIAKTEQPFERVDMNVVLRQVKTELELVIEETGTVITNDALPIFEGIPSQMSQLFSNIISNAIKFHREDVTPVINITSRRAEEEEIAIHKLPAHLVYNRIQISDNGIGFEPEYASRIFNVFQRLHGKSEYPGSGIGLAICKKILEHHNGLIYAESAQGEGAKFIFIIPESQNNTDQII